MNEKSDVVEVVRGAVTPIRVVRAAERERPAIAEEQLAYAQVLDRGMKLGFLLLLVTFLLYVSGLVSPHVPVEELPRYWSLPVREYLAATGTHGGWSWLGMLAKGDYLTFLGIAFLSGVAIVCYLAITPIFFRKKDSVFGYLALAEVTVLLLAASGVFGVGGH